MRLTIVAATGGIGRQLVEQALAAGHEVTAVARYPQGVPTQARLVAVDLARPDQAALASAVTGADAVLSALGARTAADRGVATRGTEAIALAMRATGARRLLVVSAAPIGTVASPARPRPPHYDPGDGFFMRAVLNPLVKVALREHYADLARMEDIVRASGLDWTIIRPPRLLDTPLTGVYRTAYERNLRRGLAISRADVADLMLRALRQPETIRKTVGVAY